MNNGHGNKAKSDRMEGIGNRMRKDKKGRQTGPQYGAHTPKTKWNGRKEGTATYRQVTREPLRILVLACWALAQ